MKKESVLVLFDKDEEYANRMCEYLIGCKNLPWKVASCTTENDLKKLCENRKPSVIVAASGCYSNELEKLASSPVIVLDDGFGNYSGVAIEKYRAADETLRAILEIYSQTADEFAGLELSQSEKKAVLIGVFSPVRRCYQTTFSILMGKLLLQRGKVLYLSFEFCEGCEELILPEGTKNLTDLMYFIKSPASVFSMRFKSMVRSIAGLDYIPGAVPGNELTEIPEEEWKTFLSRICSLEDYSYVILDLSESIRGIFGILRMCDKIYTLTRSDRVARRKLESYENILKLYEYEDIYDKSIRCNPPSVRRVPSISGNELGGEFVNYIKEQLGAI